MVLKAQSTAISELIHEEGKTVFGGRSEIIFQNRSEFDDIKDFRKSIVKDLEDPKTQFNYLITFLKICEKNYKTNRKEEVSRLKFLATTYNYGIDKSAAQIDTFL
jgi:hypothetical protein